MTTTTTNPAALAAALPASTFHTASIHLDGVHACLQDLGLSENTPLPDLPMHFVLAGRPIPYTLMGVMERVYCLTNGLLAYDRTLDIVYHYEPRTGLWEAITGDNRSAIVDDALQFLVEQEAPLLTSSPAAQKAIDKLLNGPQGFHNSPARYENTLRFLKNIRESRKCAAEDFDDYNELLHVGNGVINLSTGELQPWSPDLFFRTGTQTLYEKGYRCEMFDSFIRHITAGGEDPAGKMEYLQRVSGISLTGHSKEKILVRLFDAHGDTGKTTFLEALSSCLGEYAQVVEPQVVFGQSDSNNRTFAMSKLAGARLVSMAETDSENSGFRLDATAIKRFVGTDTQTARRPHESPFNFRPKYTAWVATNSDTKMSGGGDDAFWSRVKTIKFCNPIDKKDPAFIAAAQDPASPFVRAMLAWAVEGAAKYISQGLPPESVEITNAKAEYMRAVDPFADFFDDFDFAPGNWISSSKIRALYLCHESVQDVRHPPSVEAMRKALSKKLQSKSESVRVDLEGGGKSEKPVRIWRGLCPKPHLLDGVTTEQIPTWGREKVK